MIFIFPYDLRFAGCAETCTSDVYVQKDRTVFTVSFDYNYPIPKKNSQYRLGRQEKTSFPHTLARLAFVAKGNRVNRASVVWGGKT